MSRAYTPRRWDPDAAELDVDIALHEHGPGAAWAAGAKEGDTAVISGMAAPDVSFRVSLNVGEASATAWGSDLTEEYVTFNSAYST